MNQKGFFEVLWYEGKFLAQIINCLLELSVCHFRISNFNDVKIFGFIEEAAKDELLWEEGLKVLGHGR